MQGECFECRNVAERREHGKQQLRFRSSMTRTSFGLSVDVYVDMTDVFGHPTQENTAHYNRNFNVSQV
jgi:hypothetical protein